jgi:hypothetical protein
MERQAVNVPSGQQVADHHPLAGSQFWSASWVYTGHKLNGVPASMSSEEVEG